jgi:hypothetical protein
MERLRPAILLTGLAVLAAAGVGHAGVQPLGTEFRVNTETLYAEETSAVAGDANGNFVMVWRAGSATGGPNILGKRYSADGQPLTGDFPVNVTTSGSQSFPDVAASAGGGFVVVWVNANAGITQVLGRRFASDGAPLGGEFRVSPATATYPSHPSVASDSAGNFVVVWNSNAYTGGAYVAGQRYSSSGALLGARFQANTSLFALQSRPVVASDPNGNFVVAWNGYDTSSYGVMARRYSHTGAPLAGEFRASTYALNGQYHPSVATDALGNFVVVWHSDPEDETGPGVFGQRYSSTGARLGSEFRINTITSTAHYEPVVARAADGEFTVAWWSTDESVDGIFARRFSAAGAPIGNDFRVNTTTTNEQAHPSIAAFGNGNVVIAWTGFSDGSFSGVYAQRFACGVPGDLNGSGAVDVADVFYLINALFAGGPAPVCSGDVNTSGGTDVADVFYLINYLFASGPPPA